MDLARQAIKHFDDQADHAHNVQAKLDSNVEAKYLLELVRLRLGDLTDVYTRGKSGEEKGYISVPWKTVACWFLTGKRPLPRRSFAGSAHGFGDSA
jgi:hypothetical protein